jgi:SAM-dependent methyltransferase
MTESDFDVEGTFDENYLYFYEEMLTPERDAAEVAQIAELLGDRKDILDCPCGHGRIANGLAERGYRVTGLDQSELFLARAREDAERRGVGVEYVHGDMRELPWHERFDGLVNWFTSFGYFDDETNSAVLRGFHDALRPGGRLVLESQNPARLFRIMLPVVYTRHGDDFMFDVHDMDWNAWRMRTARIMIRDDKVHRTRFAVRLYSWPELRAELGRAGFANARTAVEPNTENRLVVVADRPVS